MNSFRDQHSCHLTAIVLWYDAEGLQGPNYSVMCHNRLDQLKYASST